MEIDIETYICTDLTNFVHGNTFICEIILGCSCKFSLISCSCYQQLHNRVSSAKALNMLTEYLILYAMLKTFCTILSLFLDVLSSLTKIYSYSNS